MSRPSSKQDRTQDEKSGQHYTNPSSGEEGKRASSIDAHEISELPSSRQPASSRQSSGGYFAAVGPNHQFKTYLLDEKCDKFWISDNRFKKQRRSNYYIYIFIILALGLGGVLNWRLASQVPKHDYCLVLDDSFTSIDTNVWNHEVQINGFGTGSFDWTTTDDRNAFTDSEGLHINPTLTTATTDITENQIFDAYRLNLTKTDDGDGSCTANQTSTSYNQECSIYSNITSHAIIPPVRSARLTTQGTKSILYGRVEVVAKLPKGDWLWPAIWMMPEDSVYGTWPLSGEIDIMESRGNGRTYPGGGREQYSSTLHWGPSVQDDAYWRTTRSRSIKRTDYTEGFHTYGIEWSKDYIFTYIDDRLQQVLYVDFKHLSNLWTWGQFQGRVENGTTLNNPWFMSENSNAPFDQKFYLILNVAVGSTNGWFPDVLGNKPWVNGKATAAADFYAAKDKWMPTWGKGNDGGMTVKNVKMWQEGKCT